MMENVGIMVKILRICFCSMGFEKWVAWRMVRKSAIRHEKIAAAPDMIMESWWNVKLPTIGMMSIMISILQLLGIRIKTYLAHSR